MFMSAVESPTNHSGDEIQPLEPPTRARAETHRSRQGTLRLVHRDDMEGNGMARGDPERLPALLAAHAQTAELGA